MKRIGLTQRVHYLEDIREFRDCLDQAWIALLFSAGYFPVPLPNCPEKAQTIINELQLNGIILTGGNDLAGSPNATNVAPMRDQFERVLLESSAKQNVPVLGVCRGMQFINQYYGGRICRVQDHVNKDHPIIAVNDLPIPLESRQRVNSYHNFGFKENELGPGLVKAAQAPDGTIEAFVHEQHLLWGIMWHPEREPKDMADQKILKSLFK